MREKFLLALLCCVQAGCASSSSDITAQYVSPLQYQSLSCQQLAAEGERVSQRANQLAGVQDEKSTNDAVATGVGLILFWPSLFFIKGDGQTAAELGRLRGEYDAIQQASIQRNCGFRFQDRGPPPTTTGSVR